MSSTQTQTQTTEATRTTLFFDRLMAIDPSKIDLSRRDAFDPENMKKVGQVSEFHLRLLGLLEEVKTKVSTVENELKIAAAAHHDFHEDHPEAEHGGELCQNGLAISSRLIDIREEYDRVHGVVSDIMNFDFPELTRTKHFAVCKDGSVVVSLRDLARANLEEALERLFERDRRG